MRYDLTDLELFLHVVKTGSITAGAQLSNLALASASVRIRGMEESVGAALFTRGRRGVEPTPAGRIVVHHAREVLGQLARMRGDLDDSAKGLRGSIRLLTTGHAFADALPQALSVFLIDHPSVDIALEERFSPEIVQAVGQGSADVGIASSLSNFAGLETFPFGNDRLVVITASGHPLAEQKNVAFADALGHGFIGLEKGSALQAFLESQAHCAGASCTCRARVKSVAAVCTLVGRGMGIGVVAERAAQHLQKINDIKLIPLTESWATQQLTLCVTRFDALPGYAKALVEKLRLKPAERPGQPTMQRLPGMGL